MRGAVLGVPLGRENAAIFSREQRTLETLPFRLAAKRKGTKHPPTDPAPAGLAQTPENHPRVHLPPAAAAKRRKETRS